jgi:hypothetical protein
MKGAPSKLLVRYQLSLDGAGAKTKNPATFVAGFSFRRTVDQNGE